jgi:hypothetical protein
LHCCFRNSTLLTIFVLIYIRCCSKSCFVYLVAKAFLPVLLKELYCLCCCKGSLCFSSMRPGVSTLIRIFNLNITLCCIDRTVLPLVLQNLECFKICIATFVVDIPFIFLKCLLDFSTLFTVCGKIWVPIQKQPDLLFDA